MDPIPPSKFRDVSWPSLQLLAKDSFFQSDRPEPLSPLKVSNLILCSFEYNCQNYEHLRQYKLKIDNPNKIWGLREIAMHKIGGPPLSVKLLILYYFD